MKTLIVSPCSTHPPTEGNSQRILALAGALNDLGHEVHLALLPNEKFTAGDSAAMRAYWGPRLHRLPGFHDWDVPLRLRRQAARLLMPLACQLVLHQPEPKFIDQIDEHWLDWWNLRLLLLQRRHRFDVVMVEYVFYGRALASFDRKVLKIIDTHDVFSDRDIKLSERTGRRTKWLSATPQQEAQGLARADSVIAIQQEEAGTLRRLSQRPVATVGHFIDTGQSLSKPMPDGPLLFVGSGNLLNVQGCQWFLDQVLPAVLRDAPDTVLRIVGEVGAQLRPDPAIARSLEIAGLVENLTDEYTAAALVINPVLYGTGLAIKSIEALAHHKALVCTPQGARGLTIEGVDAYPFIVCETPKTFADTLVDLLNAPDDLHTLQGHTYAYVRLWNQQQSAALAAAVKRETY